MTDDFLDRARQAARSARTLQSSGDPDGAVNRAYYAMFYAAHAALEHRGVEVASSKHGTLSADLASTSSSPVFCRALLAHP